MTTPERWHLIDALFDEALDVAPAARAAFLDGRCPPELRTSVDALLAGTSESEQLAAGEGLRGALAEALLVELERGEPVAGGPERGGWIDDCRLIRVLGEGGMGEVWEAEQTGPVRRRVALKVVKAGMDTKRVTARFDSERQALALMNHPNVAQVFGGGTAPSGRPYFVMELVRGTNLRQYCRDRDLPVPARLRLFLQVCDGVQHAHHKGLVHRDLKPSNILVAECSGQPLPKIIDFGVARALDERHAPGTTLTERGQIVGTLEYMSPEQADFVSRDVDTRSDVYSLGVILYELLADALPFTAEALPGRDYVELLRNIRETDPPRPSLRAAAERSREVRGDLDWIVMKAIEKDRDRRYVSAHELAEDVRRHLENRVVAAGPPSRTYRMRKLVRRHRAVVAGAAVAATALAAGTAIAVHQAVRATRAERAARADAETARQVSDFLVQLFEVSDPTVAKGETVTARELLDRGAGRLGEQLEGQPLVRARLETVVGEIYRKLGLYGSAAPLLEDALAMSERVLGADDPESIRSLFVLARLHSDRKDSDRAETLLRQTLARLARTPDETLEAHARRELGTVLRGKARFQESEALHRQALASLVRAHGPAHLEVGRTWQDLGNTLRYTNRPLEAEDALKRALLIKEEALGPDHLEVGALLTWVASLASEDGRLEEARGLAQRALAIQEMGLGPDHPSVATTLVVLAAIQFDLGRLEEGVGLLQRALVMRERAFGLRHHQTGIVLNNLGVAQITLARYPEARRTLERALAVSLETRGPDHPQTAFALGRLGDLHRLTGDLRAAEAAYGRALAASGTLSDSENLYFVPNLRGWARLLVRRGRLQEAETALTRALGLVEATSPSSNEIAPTLAAMAELRLRQGRVEEARGLLERALGLARTDPFTRVEVLVLLGDVRSAQGARTGAEEAYRRARDLAGRLYPAGHPERARAERGLASPPARARPRGSSRR